ncbi:hypothetical protein CONCODRAFT_77099 [Conidiobolus coronatus NRRL 28638]|uniref:Uncharacterized protein n=1 Tax=Conidiobolus coronatus (strain ATCC 28846 / CBS 209.66 / NRRL 28638) TaxID=796925 RepID=A0A137PG53_CONC2|nr:hypothetical protein CONCODRAFT_77099 [Conidiobolus coronatus NRRL 28638]|eukprot:KXN73955.1 hypothetical protein CONCODRAFT_77099 [Conidiobolus coronatus NRRL 28638]
MFDYFYLAELEKAKTTPRHSAYSTPASSRLTSPVVSRKPSLELLTSKETKVKITKPKYIRLVD